MSVVYDAGVLLAAERDQVAVWAEHKAWLELGFRPLTTAPVVAQVSRSPRQARLRLFLRGCDVLAFSPDQAHQVGALLARAGTSDVVDAHLAIVGAGNEIVTSDPDDLSHLAAHLDSTSAVRHV
ncbi:hypothetical protein ASG90_12795 [Nocardioides sp. Soil797]|nr:hypothetical protein ASG90_12795 [Nocardioides sp. Soil797]